MFFKYVFIVYFKTKKNVYPKISWGRQHRVNKFTKPPE